MFTIFCCLFLSQAIPGFNLQEAAPLLLNAPVSRDFKNGTKDIFSVPARENEIIEITCERKGVDLALAAFAPNGEKISVSNAPGGFAGSDRLFFVAEKTGEYRIELDSRRPGNIGGSYTILLKDERPAGEKDLQRAEAMKLLGAAREILFGAENRLEKSAQAVEKLKKALALFEKTDDFQGQATALFHLAYINGNELGAKAKAIGLYEKSLDIWSKTGDEAGKAICLTYLADEMRDYDSLENPRSFYVEKSQGYFDEALSLHRKFNNKLDEAAALTSLCRMYNDTQNFQKGFEACRESLRLEEDKNPLTDYRTYTNLASLYSNSGDLENALKYNRIALERYEIVKDYENPYRLAFIKSNVGGILANQKRYAEAEQNLSEALKITEEVKRTLYSGYIRVRLGLIYYETQRFTEALKVAKTAVENYREIDPVKIQAALNVLGNTYFALKQTDDARRLFTEAVETNRQTKDRYAEADSLYNLAKLENQAGNLETARQNIELAISNSEVIRAQFLGKNQRTSYLSILKKYYELEIEVLIKLYEKTADVSLLEQAWQNHEKIRARSLMENLIESGLNLNEFAPKDFFTQEQTLLEAIAAAEFKRVEALKAKNPVLQNEAEAELNKKLDEYQILQENVRQKNPQFSALNQSKNFALADAQKLIDENTAIVEFALGAEESYVWVIRKDSLKLAKLPSKAVINKAARELYLALTDRVAKNDKAVIEKSKNLSREILSPVAGEVKNAKQIVVIADGGLQLIPFSALTLTPDAVYQPVASTIEIVNAPSFASLAFLRENKASRQKSSDKLLAVFADPVFQEDDERFEIKSPTPKNPSDVKDLSNNLAMVLRDFGLDRLARLPFSGFEAREIGKFAPEQTVLALGTDASRQNFLRGDFNSYRILHFATHGFLNQQNPELSGLVLSLYDENRNPQNGFLRVIDLYSLHLNTDLVVLSACQTALGKDIDGEGIVGLTRGFMYSGASGVVSSLWKVEDAATAELMKRFYRAMLKDNQTPSAALRTAQNELRQIPRFSNPRFWSGFTLNGE
ncbi:MAG TPA: CHAT domain-containing protein [Pyrinomonadaceae bacterium]|nr:CHAT domain-containing protein [Pyrinomonadaceae bacterium]